MHLERIHPHHIAHSLAHCTHNPNLYLSPSSHHSIPPTTTRSSHSFLPLIVPLPNDHPRQRLDSLLEPPPLHLLPHHHPLPNPPIHLQSQWPDPHTLPCLYGLLPARRTGARCSTGVLSVCSTGTVRCRAGDDGVSGICAWLGAPARTRKTVG